MTQYAMIIDLQKCVGCGGCALACKTENNTTQRKNGQTHNWADFIHETKGKFPNTRYRTLPVMCNHCSDAPCVEVCPAEPKAMYKTKDGITMCNEERCVGCRECQTVCPYSMEEVKSDGAYGEYSVISFNEEDEPIYPFYANSKELIAAGTSSGTDTAKTYKATPPHKTGYSDPDYNDSRRDNVIEKCFFCRHRVAAGKMPYCVDSCPSGARIFGDKDDPTSNVAKLLKKYKSFVLKPKEGTKPNVYYIRDYGGKKA